MQHPFLHRDLGRPIIIDSPRISRDLTRTKMTQSVKSSFAEHEEKDDIYVLHWVFRKGVCFAYVLSNGRIGALFDDGSAMVCESNR